MKRALVFLLLGPALVVPTIWVAVGVPLDVFVANMAMPLLAVTFPVLAIAGLLDGYLARTIPMLLRALLIGLVGATVGTVLPAVLLGLAPQYQPILFGLGGAFCAGVCSLLAHDYSAGQSRPGDVSGSPS